MQEEREEKGLFFFLVVNINFLSILAFCLDRTFSPLQAASWMVYEKQYHSSC